MEENKSEQSSSLERFDAVMEKFFKLTSEKNSQTYQRYKHSGR